MPRAFVVTNSPVHGAKFLLCIPAERADLLLLDLAELRGDRLIMTYNPPAVETEFGARAVYSGTTRVRPWAKAFAGLIERVKAGHIAVDTIPRAIAYEHAMQKEYLFSGDEMASLVDDLDEDAEIRLARKWNNLDIDGLLSDARKLLAENKTKELEALIEENIPDELRPAISRLRALAAKRLVKAMKKGGSVVIALDAWLALGPDGVLARLSHP